jgi:hypothetical protein
MNIALGSATLICMAKLGCGALASGFIASHNARADNPDSSPGKISRKWTGPVANVPRLNEWHPSLGAAAVRGGSEPFAAPSKSAEKEVSPVVGSASRDFSTQIKGALLRRCHHFHYSAPDCRERIAHKRGAYAERVLQILAAPPPQRFSQFDHRSDRIKPRARNNGRVPEPLFRQRREKSGRAKYGRLFSRAGTSSI